MPESFASFPRGLVVDRRVDFMATLLKLKAGMSFLRAAASGMTPGVGPATSNV